MTGTPSARQASDMPRIASRNCHDDLGVLGVAEVEAVGQAHRLRADAGEVPHRLGHRLGTAAPRVE